MSITERIQDELDRIEEEKEIKILLAVESGSRAWGFPSPDSDYDVRFIYAHPTNWYLSMRERRDVVEMPIDEILDISGWDIRKAFRLLVKSNGSLLEWLSSPIVYRINEPCIAPLKSLIPELFSVEALFYHYYSMSKGMIYEATNSDSVKLKTYLYALRSLLCCQWLLEYRKTPPIEFDILKERYFPPKHEMHDLINLLLADKAVSIESKKNNRIPLLDSYLQIEIEKLKGSMDKYSVKTDFDRVDNEFRKTLSLVTK